MTSRIASWSLAAAALMTAGGAIAKLPAPSDDAKAKAAEAAAKAAWGGKVAGYQLCQSQDRVAARYLAEAKKAGKEQAPAATPPCADPGPYVAPTMAAAPAETASAPKK